ncbi:MAG: hypothetical protein JW737_00145 [Acidobacteria bacterium]|nr:hypothetical protein [Acidobacteriota bacterium]
MKRVLLMFLILAVCVALFMFLGKRHKQDEEIITEPVVEEEAEQVAPEEEEDFDWESLIVRKDKVNDEASDEVTGENVEEEEFADGSQEVTSETFGETSEKVKIEADIYENSFIKVEIPQGWIIFDESKTKKKMRFYPIDDKSPDAPQMYLQFEGNSNWEGTPKEAIKKIADAKYGTTPKRTLINNISYWKTTYDSEGKQMVFITKKSGNKVTITINGKDAERTPQIGVILKTLIYKDVKPTK